MLFSLKKLIDLLGYNSFSLLLRMVLDRYPIIIIGRIRESLDDLANAIISLAPHRTQLVFYNDFVELEEYNNIIQEELDNFAIPRIVVCSHTEASQFALENNFELTGWIIAFKVNDNDEKDKIISKILHEELCFLAIFLDDEEQIKIEPYGNNLKALDLSFEKKLLKLAQNNNST